MSPRRSSRARSSQQPPAPSHTNSTTSTTSSVPKADRNTRANPPNHNLSPRGESIQRSESVDEIDSAAAPTATEPTLEPIMPRRSRRNGEDKEQLTKPQDTDDRDVAGVVEEEVTRCICGQAEYPGPSASVKEQFTDQDPLTDDIGNFFVQCDQCGVWQHGGCMGLTDEANLPDEYYCEQCKPEFHKVLRGPNGSKSSRYLPFLQDPSTRSSSLSPNAEQGRNKASKGYISESTKRRATMNSRGAYDEDEMLRRAIEESKEMGTLGKRTREESEDNKQLAVKRQRTNSRSPSSESKRSQSLQPTGEDASSRPSTMTSRNGSKLRNGSARNNQEKELRDKQKEQVAASRAEAASKRNARSEKRRGEDSPPPTPSLSPSKLAAAIATNSKSKADTPPASRSAVNRKTGRPIARRGRLGRNQYTRDVPTNGDQSDTPMRDTSHDRNTNGSPPSATNGINGESGRSSKAKTHPARTSMNEMKRRVAAILEFVGRMQTERVSTQPQQNSTGSSSSSKGANTPSNNTTVSTNLPTASLVKAVEAGLKEVNQNNHKHGDRGSIGLKLRDDRDFGGKGSIEMMEIMTKELVQWQTVYGIYSR